LRKEAIKNLGAGASEKAIFKEAMRIDNAMFEASKEPTFRESKYAEKFGFKFDGDIDAYSTTMDSYHHMVEQAWKTQDAQNYMIDKLQETIPDFDGKTMTNEGYKKAARQYKTWMEAVINGTPNKEGVGITGIGLRNNEAYSKAHFSMARWGNAADDAELTVGTNGVNLTSKMSAIDPTLKSLDDPRQALLYGKNVVKHFCCYSGKVLEKFTHSEYPWLKTRGKIPELKSSTEIIKKEYIGKYFKDVKEKYNMINPNDIESYAKKMFDSM